MVALSSVNRDHKCWTPEDLEPAVAILTEYLQIVIKGSKEVICILNYCNITNLSFCFYPVLPLHLMGASSGGAFAGELAVFLNQKQQPQDTTTTTYRLTVSSICVQIRYSTCCGLSFSRLTFSNCCVCLFILIFSIFMFKSQDDSLS
jgi:hypothetical protein